MKKLIIAICLLGTTLVAAQQSESNVEKGLLKLNVMLAPSLEYEIGIAKNSTLNVGIGTEWFYSVDNVSDKWKFGLNPSVNASYRYYYNFEKRINKGRNTKRNSANYVALNTQYIKGGDAIVGDTSYQGDYIGVIETMWGIQRNYNSGLSLGLEMGAGYSFNNLETSIFPSVNLKLGWVLGKK